MTIEATAERDGGRDGAVLVLEPSGRLHAEDVEALEQPIRDSIRSGNRNIVIDLRHVESMDSAGIRALLTIAARIMINRGELRLCELNDGIYTLFTATDIDQVVDIVDTCDEAVASFD